MNGEGYLTWLRTLVRDRISGNIRLDYVDEKPPRYRLWLAEKAIEMPAWEWGYGNDVNTHAIIDLEGFSLSTSASVALPAPNIGEGSQRQPILEETPNGYFIHYDILGLAYWMLSRSEEIGRTDLDIHGRFPATSSHAFRNGYLHRPVVDEWFLILRELVRRVWQELSLAEASFRTSLSHDVDEPSRYAFRSLGQVSRSVVGDLLKRRDLVTAVRRPRIALTTRARLDDLDPCNTFPWIMDMSEKYDLRSTFYFVCGRTEPSYDPSYEIQHYAIRQLLTDIHQRGHEIGLHPSYGTFLAPEFLAKEAARLLKVCNEVGVKQAEWGSRMHYLRWATPKTLYALEAAGMAHDNTLVYADYPGFRCGTCFEYTAFDPLAGESVNLRIRPLIAMECTVLSDEYMGLGISSDAFDTLASLKNACRRVAGVFSLLWHNSQLTSADERDLYKAVLSS